MGHTVTGPSFPGMKQDVSSDTQVTALSNCGSEALVFGLGDHLDVWETAPWGEWVEREDVRRNTKRYLACKAADAAAEAGDAGAAEALDMIDTGFGLREWEMRRSGLIVVSDWTKEDEALRAAYKCIHLDADFEWISAIMLVASLCYVVPAHSAYRPSMHLPVYLLP